MDNDNAKNIAHKLVANAKETPHHNPMGRLVHAFNQDGKKICFSTQAVSHTSFLSETQSEITLSSGLTLTANLPYNDLWHELYKGSALCDFDLTLYQAQPQPTPPAETARTSMPPQPLMPLTKSLDLSIRSLVSVETFVTDWIEMIEQNNLINVDWGKSSDNYLKFKDRPSECKIPMPLKEFQKHCQRALEEGKTYLDLTPYHFGMVAIESQREGRQMTQGLNVVIITHVTSPKNLFGHTAKTSHPITLVSNDFNLAAHKNDSAKNKRSYFEYEDNRQVFQRKKGFYIEMDRTELMARIKMAQDEAIKNGLPHGTLDLTKELPSLARTAGVTTTTFTPLSAPLPKPKPTPPPSMEI